jgi:hypothetical protein
VKTEELIRRDAEARILREAFSEVYAVLGIEATPAEEREAVPPDQVVALPREADAPDT